MKLFYTTTLLALLTLQTHALTVSVSVVRPSYCGRASGILTAYAEGGVPPYTIMWSNGWTQGYNSGLAAGTYSVTVTDSQLEQATGEGEVPLLNSYDYSVNPPPILMHCPEDPMHLAVYTGMLAPGVQPPTDDIYGPNPYSFSGPGLTQLGQSTSCQDPNGVVWELLTFDGVQPGYYQLDYTDANGCPGTFNVTLGGEMSWPDLQVIDISPSCPNYTTGSFTFACLGTDLNSSYGIRWRSDSDPSSCGHLNYSFDLAGGTTGQTVSGLDPGDYWLIMTNDALEILQEGTYSYLECKDSILVTIPALTQDCGVVTGQLYIDENANCTRNGGENRIPSSIIEITPGPTYVTTSSTGYYTVALPFGDYTFTEQNPTYIQSCPGDVTINAGVTQTMNIGCEGGVPLDVQVAMANGPARPGFELQYGINLQNLTSGSPGTVTFTMTFDPNLSYLRSTRTPTSIVGNVITWTTPQLNMNLVFQETPIRVDFQIPPDVGLIGSTLNTSIELTTTNTDVDLSNNVANSAQLVTGSFDPNDKVATTSSRASGTEYFIDADEWIDYTIRFQNTGTDTAFTVIITDTLPNTLDPATVQWGATSHTGTRRLSGNGLLKFIFPNILLPDSNVNEAASHGFVSFRIKPREPVLLGSTIENTANIFFDFNPPVITDPSVLTVTSPGVALSPRMLLGGPYVQATQRMSDGLRSAGLIPLTEPYTALGYSHVSGGGETTTAQVLAITGDNAIVDWVVVELRSTLSPYTVVATKSALLQRDGDVVSSNGTGPLVFDLAPSNYRIAVRHRNHLGVMSNASFALGTTSTVADFSLPTTATYGTNAQATIGTSRALWAGDCQSDGELKYTGDGNDRDLILLEIGGLAPTATTTGYVREDVNMDGIVKYTGANNDRDRILVNIGGSVPTNVVVEQLP